MAEEENLIPELPSEPIIAETAAIRYYSRGGNVEAMAEALSRGAGVPAISIDEKGSRLKEHVDILFIGGALYAWKLDEKLVNYIEHLDPEKVGTAVVFGSSALFRRPILLIQSLLKDKGIKVNQQAVYARNHPNDQLLAAMEYFAKNEMTRDRSLDGLPPWLIAKRGREEMEARQAAKAGSEDEDTEE